MHLILEVSAFIGVKLPSYMKVLAYVVDNISVAAITEMDMLFWKVDFDVLGMHL